MSNSLRSRRSAAPTGPSILVKPRLTHSVIYGSLSFLLHCLLVSFSSPVYFISSFEAPQQHPYQSLLDTRTTCRALPLSRRCAIAVPAPAAGARRAGAGRGAGCGAQARGGRRGVSPAGAGSGSRPPPRFLPGANGKSAPAARGKWGLGQRGAGRPSPGPRPSRHLLRPAGPAGLGPGAPVLTAAAAAEKRALPAPPHGAGVEGPRWGGPGRAAAVPGALPGGGGSARSWGGGAGPGRAGRSHG